MNLTRANAFCYTLHGLNLQSNLEIPGLASRQVDSENEGIVVEWLPRERREGEAEFEADPKWVHQDPGGGVLRVWTRTFEGDAAVRLGFSFGDAAVTIDLEAGGRRIRIDHTSEVPRHNAAMLLLGTGFRYVLQLRGRPALHAAAVECCGNAIALVGVQGAGKSTTTAALAERGCRILCDDLAALVPVQSQWCVSPGVPSLRLGREALTVLGRDGASASPVWARTPQMSDVEYGRIDDKALLSEARSSLADARRSVPLAGIYVLRNRIRGQGTPRVGALTPAEAMGELSLHLGSFPMPGSEATKSAFRFLAELTQSCPVRFVERPDDLQRLPQVCEAILADAQSLAAARGAA